MALSDYIPNYKSPQPPEYQGPTESEYLEATSAKATSRTLTNVMKSFKPNSLSVASERGLFSGFITTRSNFEAAPYDFDRIIKAIDTDSYAQQAFSKYRELIWKEGWEIIGKNDDAVAYLWKRINLMEVAMKRSFYDFLVEVADQLVKFNNVFIVKARGDLAPFFPGKLYPPTGEKPIVGYYVLPTEKVEILRDKHNRPIKYRQRTDDTGSADAKGDPEWPAKDVIHLTRNRKPARLFGTPFVIAALDDIVSLRQMEEDMLNLFHRELFPLYFYTVGTDVFPADKKDIDQAEQQLGLLRSEGGLIAPHTHNLEILGAENKALNITSELQHFKERVAVGLGVFPHHLGMAGAGTNRSATDRLDIALYDKVKEYQKYIAEEIRRDMFNDLLIEGGFDPFGLGSMAEAEDRCMFQFNEIDQDTKIKRETHEMGKFDRSMTAVDEVRRATGHDNELDEEGTSDAIKARIATQNQIEVGDAAHQNALELERAKPKPAGASGSSPAKKAVRSGTPTKKSSTGRANPRSASKGSGNIVRPANQHGTRTSPNIRHSSEININELIDMPWLDAVESLLED